MAAIRASAALVIAREIFRPSSSSIRTLFRTPTFRLISYTTVRCAADSGGGGNKKTSARLSQVQQQLHEAIERSVVGGNDPIPKITLGSWSNKLHPVRCAAAGGSDSNKKTSSRLSQVQQQLHEAIERSVVGNDPIPKITLDHVTVSFARSGGPGGQNVNKVNTKVDMRFNVKAAHWLSDRVRDKILQTEKNRINKDGELVISSTKTRTQKGNIEDALEKLQAIIDAASYVPPPPSEEQVKKITKIAAAAEHKRLQNKKVLSQKKAFRRSRDSYD